MTKQLSKNQTELAVARALLSQSLDALHYAGCLFFACDGWAKPAVNASTCITCWAIRDILLSGLVPRPPWAKGVRLRWPKKGGTDA